ncbi:hypothetical protein J6590_008087 [Homalodisca vitripennis]|nr:hypothetical protein J6590_008087 [Homalodisca vitripennis]
MVIRQLCAVQALSIGEPFSSSEPYQVVVSNMMHHPTYTVHDQYGRVQSVKLLPRAKDDEGSGACATVSFMDIKSASKAHNNEQKLEDRTLTTEYHEPAAIPGSAAPIYSSQRFSHGSRWNNGNDAAGCVHPLCGKVATQRRSGRILPDPVEERKPASSSCSGAVPVVGQGPPPSAVAPLCRCGG